MATNPLACPTCHDISMVQKISALFTAGTAEANYAGTSRGLATGVGGIAGGGGFGFIGTVNQNIQISGMQQTYLAQTLMPPPRPVRREAFTSFYTIMLVLLGCSAFVILQMLPNAFRSGSPSNLLEVVFLNLVLSGGSVLLWLWRFRKRQQFGREWQAQMITWQKQMANWNQLYLCMRDETLFYPGTNLSGHLSQMYPLITEA